MFQTVQRPGVYSGTVHYREPLKSFDMRVGIVPASGFLLSRYCHDCRKGRKAIFTHALTILQRSIDYVDIIVEKKYVHLYIFYVVVTNRKYSHSHFFYFYQLIAFPEAIRKNPALTQISNSEIQIGMCHWLATAIDRQGGRKKGSTTGDEGNRLIILNLL